MTVLSLNRVFQRLLFNSLDDGPAACVVGKKIGVKGDEVRSAMSHCLRGCTFLSILFLLGAKGPKSLPLQLPICFILVVPQHLCLLYPAHRFSHCRAVLWRASWQASQSYGPSEPGQYKCSSVLENPCPSEESTFRTLGE